jgi:hypothetical protein
MADIDNKEMIPQCIEAFAGPETRNYIESIRSASKTGFTFYVPRPNTLLRVLEIGRDAVPYLTELLRRSDEEIRIAALRALWEITSKHYGADDFAEFSCTEIVTGRWPDIIESWQRWWDANKDRPEFEWLSEQIKSGSPADKSNAVRRFGELGDNRAIPLLVEAISDPDIGGNRFNHQILYGALARLGDGHAVPYLIDVLLTNDIKSFRFEGLRFLTDIIGETMGYDPEGSVEARSESIRKWREWWEQNKEKYL